MIRYSSFTGGLAATGQVRNARVLLMRFWRGDTRRYFSDDATASKTFYRCREKAQEAPVLTLMVMI